MRLFGRVATLIADTIKIESRPATAEVPRPLRIRFDVTKTSDGKPNKAKIDIWNLNPNHRAQLENAPYVPVQLDAGYVDGTSTIFLGNLRSARTVKSDGKDWITSLECGDGELAVQTARVNVTIAKGTDTDQVLRTLAKALGVGEGNLAQAAQTIRSAFSGTGNIFTAGTVLSGHAATEMDRICRSLNLEWSIQGGKLQILERTKALEGTAILLGVALERFGHNGSGGMIGSPTIAIDSKDKRQTLTAKMALQPDVAPGRLMVVNALNVSGQFRIEDTHHNGDIGTDDWYVEVKAKRY